MNCPIDDAELQAREENGIAYRSCGECHGMFFTKDELLGCLKAGNVEAVIPTEPSVGFEVTQKVIKRVCPSCKSATMLDKLLDDVAIDICPDCKGVWLDAGELKKIVARHRRKLFTAGKLDRKTAASESESVLSDVGIAVIDFFGFGAEWLGDAGSNIGEFFSID